VTSLSALLLSEFAGIMSLSLQTEIVSETERQYVHTDASTILALRVVPLYLVTLILDKGM